MLDSPRALAEALRLDRQFQKLVYEIEQRCGILNRQAAMRIRHWIAHLSAPTANLTWKRNRNQHGNVLLHQLEKGRLTQPFDREPTGPVGGNLPSHVVAEFKASMRACTNRTSWKVSTKADARNVARLPASESPKASAPPLQPVSESPTLQSTDQIAWGRNVDNDIKHRRCVSAQATPYHACEDHHPHGHEHGGGRGAGGKPSLFLSNKEQMQTDVGTCDVQQLKVQEKHRLPKNEQTIHYFDTHHKVQQCQNLLRSRSEARKSEASRSWRRASRFQSCDLSVPEIKVHLKDALTCGYRQSPKKKQQTQSHDVGQLSNFDPPPAFGIAATSASSGTGIPWWRSDPRDAPCSLSLGNCVPLKTVSPSTSDSSEEPRAASCTISSDSSGSNAGKTSPEEESKPLNVHPNVLRAHLGRIRRAEEHMHQGSMGPRFNM